MIKVLPSVLAADPMRIGEEVKKIMDAGADALHVDIMDGHFVPNLSYGPALVSALRRTFPALYLDVHLMLSEPENYISKFLDAGASALTIHVEAEGNLGRMLSDIQEHVPCGLSLRPGTGVETLFPYLPVIDQVLIMTVEPGFGGQKMKEEALKKIPLLREQGFKGEVSVDGGVNAETARGAVAAGATMLVMGTAVFKASDPKKVICECKEYA